MFGNNQNGMNGYPQNGYPQPNFSQQYPSQYVPQYNTNIIRVMSLDEAIMRNNARGSENIYFDQDRDVFYRVRTEWDGRKVYGTFSYSVYQPEQAPQAPQAPVVDFSALEARVKAIEDKLNPKPEEVVNNG